jgi:hypothetical protein
VGFAAGLALAMLSFPVHAAPAGSGDIVQGLYDALLSTMKNGQTLGQSGRFAQLEPVIRRTFDIPSMARLSVGSYWATLTEAQQQQVTESFGRYIAAIYADRFDSYAGQKLQVTGEQPVVAGIMVRSQIVKANGEAGQRRLHDAPQWRQLADLRHLSRRRDQRGGDPPLRICRDPEEPRHRRPNRSAQPQGRHSDGDYGKSIVAALPETWTLAAPVAVCGAATDFCATPFASSQPDPLHLALGEPFLRTVVKLAGAIRPYPRSRGS